MWKTNYNKLSEDAKETLEMVSKLNDSALCRLIDRNNVSSTDGASLHAFECLKNAKKRKECLFQNK